MVGTPCCTTMSLSASGTPASGEAGGVAGGARARRPPGPAPARDSVETCRKACTAPSTASIRSRCARVTSSALTSPPADRAGQRLGRHPGQLAGRRSLLFSQDLRDAEAAVLGRPAHRPARLRGSGPGRTTSSRYTLVSGTACVVGSMSVRGGHRAHRRHRVQDHRQLADDRGPVPASVSSSRASWARWATSSRVSTCGAGTVPGRFVGGGRRAGHGFLDSARRIGISVTVDGLRCRRSADAGPPRS